MNDQASYWEKDSFLKPYDAIIIGAGIVGLSTALFYKQVHPNARVAVLERGIIPRGASTRNAGFACVGSVGEHMADLEKESEENIKARIARRYNGLELLKRTLGEEEIGYEACGGYELFTSETDFQKAGEQVGRFNGWMEELIGESSVYRREELEGYPVIHNRLEGALHPGKMMQALVDKVGRAGVEIKWNAPVEQVHRDGTLTLNSGWTFRADRILLAANGFIRRLLPQLQVLPARGLVLVTGEQERLPWKGTFHYDCGYIYFRNVGNRLLIGGARNMAPQEEETDEFGTNNKIKSHLIRFVSEVLKLPQGWSIEQEWSGIMGFTPTKTPLLQRLNRHCFVAAGLSGMGVAIGMNIAREAVEMLSE